MCDEWVKGVQEKSQIAVFSSAFSIVMVVIALGSVIFAALKLVHEKQE